MSMQEQALGTLAANLKLLPFTDQSSWRDDVSVIPASFFDYLNQTPQQLVGIQSPPTVCLSDQENRPVIELCLCPDYLVAQLIGKGGVRIKRTEHATKCRNREVHIKGANCAYGKQVIQDFVEKNRVVTWHEVLEILENDGSLDLRVLAILRRVHANNRELNYVLGDYNRTKPKDLAELKLNLQYLAEDRWSHLETPRNYVW